jgi:hypothetical protein
MVLLKNGVVNGAEFCVEDVMEEFDDLSTSELRGLIARMSMRLEQYEIHAKALQDGSAAREGASALVARMQDRVAHLIAVLHFRELGAVKGPDARTPVVHRELPAAMLAGTSDNEQGRAA